jgi:hypothetical protein
MNTAKIVAGHVIDLKPLSAIPGITKENSSDNAMKLLELARTLETSDPATTSLKGLDFAPCYQISRGHVSKWTDDVSALQGRRAQVLWEFELTTTSSPKESTFFILLCN